MGFEQIPNPAEQRQPHTPESADATLESAIRVLEDMRNAAGFEEYTDITSMYHALPSETLIVRREDPEALMKLITDEEPLAIQFVGDLPYANSVVWNPKADGSRGIDNAFLEGYGHLDGVVTVYGFRQPDDFYLEQHPESMQIFGGVERSRVRSAAGFVPPEAVRFVTVRIPLRSFPKALMTEEERDLLWEYEHEGRTGPAFVYRGFLAKEKAADLPMAA